MSSHLLPAAGIKTTLDSSISLTSVGSDKPTANLRAKKNAISYEWPAYLAKNPHLLVANAKGQLSLLQDNKPDLAKKSPPKTLINTKMKFGMSKESPFTTKYTEAHPLTQAFGDKYVASL